MTEHLGSSLEANEVVVARFQEVLGRISTPEALFLRNLMEQRLIRLTTDESVIRIIKNGRSFGVIGFSVCLDPKTSSAKAIIAIDANEFNLKGPRALEGNVRDLLEKFYVNKIVAESHNLEWQFLEDQEIHTYLEEAASNRGKGYQVLHM